MYLHIKPVDCPLCQIQMPEKLKTLEINNDNETLLYILQYTVLIYWNFIKSVTLTFPNDLDLLIALIILQAHVTTNIHIYASIVCM